MKKASPKHNPMILYFKRFDRTMLADIFVRTTLAIFFAFSAGIYYRNALAQLNAADMSQINAASVSLGFSIFTSALFTMMIACLYVLRHRPKNKFVGWWPSFAAILGGFMMFGLVWFPPNDELSIEWRVTGSMLILIGNIFAVYALFNLGRSFSILPEGRALVTKGPYKIIRHPLYVAEGIASLGTMILMFSAGTVVLVIAQTLFQLVRIHYEEKVLTETFPEYKKYAKTTARLVPGVY